MRKRGRVGKHLATVTHGASPSSPCCPPDTSPIAPSAPAAGRSGRNGYRPLRRCPRYSLVWPRQARAATPSRRTSPRSSTAIRGSWSSRRGPSSGAACPSSSHKALPPGRVGDGNSNPDSPRSGRTWSVRLRSWGDGNIWRIFESPVEGSPSVLSEWPGPDVLPGRPRPASGPWQNQRREAPCARR